MANIDIFDNFENYLENKKFRAFLYTPSNQLVRELEMINPVLSLIKVGFNTLEFQLPAKIFDLGTLSLSSNDTIDYALDGYEVEVWVGDLTKVDAYDIYRFIVKGRPSSMVDEKPVFSYSAISSEWELQKLPIINWPGIEKMAYKQTSRPYQSQPQTGDPENSNPQLTNQTAQGDIKLVKKPKDGTVVVTRIHTEYGVEIPLFETNFEDSSGMSEGEYHIYKFQNEYFLTAYVPANIKLPIDNAGTVRWNDPIDEYQFFIYYETDDEVFQEDLDIEITDEPHYSTFEEEPYFSKDGLTINEIVEDLFKNLESEDSNMKNFLGWTYSETSTQITDIRSGLSFETTNLYEILKSLQENYQVYIDYDTVNRVVKILPDDFGTNNGLRFEYGKYLKGINQDFNVDEQVNYVQGKDANSIGFADVSWSGDNYLENYTYQLDGVEWSPNPAPTVTGLPSRWLSDGLATELAKRKHYQEFYREEVWGASSLADSITKRRFDLQEQLTRKQFELEQIEAAIKQKDGLIEAYNNETDPQVKINLDVTSRNTAYLIPVTTEANTTKISLNDEVIRLTEVDQIATKTFSINFHKRLVRSFKIEGGPNSNWTNNLLVYGLSKLFKENIKIIFKDEGTPIKEIFFTISGISRDGNLINLFDKLIDLNELIEADEISIEASVKVLKLITNMPSIIFKNIYLYTVDDENEGIRAWKTFVERQNYLKQNLETQQSQKIIEIGKISNEVKLDFDPEQPFDTNKIYSLSELEQRLDYIRTFTSIDYNSLSEPQKIELKRIRRGQVYENTDIIDSKTLFEASEKFLLENINPSITIDIDSISILQAYEAQSDWHKVRIGEKVDIFVPDLKISIEAEIVEMSIDFQNYATALKIATTKNYDKRFGKYFANVYTLLQNTFQNIIKPTQKPNEGAVVFIEDKKDLIESNLSGGPVNIGSSTGDGESNNTQNQPSILALGTVVINPLTEQLVTTPPPELFQIYGDLIIGTAKITNGGFYIKDQNDNLRVALNAKDGFIGYKQNSETGDTEETFKIDLNGNATFSGELKAASGTFSGDLSASGGTFTGTLEVGVTLSDGETTLTDALSSINTLIENLEDQIDGAISTWFAEGVPTLDNFPAEDWTTNEIKDIHLGDLYYDTVTGYAYRFALVGPTYQWIQITDTDVVAALANAATAQATADGKMTYYTASSSVTLNSALDATAPKDGDILVPSVDFTHTTPGPNVSYKANTIYKYDESLGIFVPEEKKDGSVGGWTINATTIQSNNGEIVLDNNNSKITIGFGDGQVILDGAATGEEPVIAHENFELRANGDAIFSGDLLAAKGSFGVVEVDPAGSITVGNIVISNSGIIATNGVTPNPPQTFNLSAINGDLTIKGGLSAASAVQFSDVNVSINQPAYGYEQPGIFLGVIEQDGLKERFSIVGPGTDPNYLKWTGDTLDLQGDLGGTIGKISVEGETGLIEITEDGVFGYKDKENKNDSSFSLTKNGELTLEGTITATAGDIGGWEIQKLDSGSSGIFSGGVFLKDGQLGKVGELTISSDGYISGRKFSIQKNGSASFNDLKALASVDLGDVKRQIVTQAIDWPEQVTQETLTSTCSSNTCYTIIRQVSFPTRDINFLTISKLIDESDEFILNKQYNFIFKNGSTIVNSLGLASSGREVFDSEKIFDFGQTIRSVNSITLEIQHSSSDSGKIVKIRNGVVSSSASNLQIKSIKDTATPADFDRILMIDDSDKQIVKGGPEFNTSVNNRTRFLRNDGTWQAPAIFGVPEYGISGALSGNSISTAYNRYYAIPVSSTTFMYVFTGFVTVAIDPPGAEPIGTGTATITLPIAITNGNVQATVASSNASGPGLDGVYAFIASGQTSNFTITNDFTSSNNSDAVMFTVIGYSTSSI